MPEGWKKIRVEDVAKVLRGASPRPKGDPRYYGGDIPRLMGADVSRDGRYVTPKIDSLTSEGAKLSRFMPKGTLTIVCSGDVGTPSFLAVDACIHDGFLAVENLSSSVLPEYLYEVFCALKAQLERSATHGGVFTNLTTDILREFSFLCPPLPEQHEISHILRTWDEAIETLKALKATKETRRKGILQDLLHIDRSYPSDWDVRPINKIATRIQRKNDGGNHPVLTISAKSGFLMQSDKFARDMAGSSVDRYTLLYEGEFAFNKGNSKTAPYGCIFPLNRPSAVIPFVYYCFKLNDELHSAFYSHLFAAGVLNHQLSRLINSGVRNDGLFNLYASDFFGCQVPVPPIAEQKSIAQAITAMNTELDLLDAEIDALQRQKRGLMQKLLTGEWRVNAGEDNNEISEKEAAHG